MAAEIPRFHTNTLEPVQIDRQSLEEVREALRLAARRGISLIEDNPPFPDPVGTIYNGDLGIMLLALRLERQAKYLATPEMPTDSLISEFRRLAASRVNPHIHKANPRPGRLSPIGSFSLGAAVTRIIAGISRLPVLDGEGQHRVHKRDVATLGEAVGIALNQAHLSGGDEVLYGRAGLLFALLNLRTLAPELRDESVKEMLKISFADIPKLVNVIVETGLRGSEDYKSVHGSQEALPLMWPWHEKFYVGAVHGICGILAALLACRPAELATDSSHDHHAIIAETISALCTICISNKGHLPSSLPSRPSSRGSPLVQICHGAPGLLILLSYAKRNPNIVKNHWKPEWTEALRLSSDVIWEQGLLYKGGGLCHGIAGNAWPFLLLHDDIAYGQLGESETDTAFPDLLLSRGLTFLLEARRTQPFGQRSSGGVQYRMPDTPYSLFEGLAGTVAGFTEACVVICARLRHMDVCDTKGPEALKIDKKFHEILSDELGFPGFSTRGFL